MNSKFNLINPVLIALLLVVGLSNAGEPPADQEMREGIVVFSVFPEIKADIPVEGAKRLGIPAIDSFMDQVNAHLVERTFPHCLPPVPGGADLTTIYTMYFPESMPVMSVCDDMSKLHEIEFAEPWYIDKVYFDPNDPHRGNQYGLDLCQAYDAYDISTGDPAAVVGIVDTGTDMNHPDLEANIWMNEGEDLNGDGVIQNNERNDEDDDRNGYVDDFYGWDFYSDDNNPDDRSGHGTHVSGIASAVTNNRVGVASVGYSCSIMAVRTGHGLTVTHGYQGIEYATRNGASVINCSWGGGGGNDWTRRVINYAYDNDVLVVAAAGNENTNRVSYPAGYENAVAVAATDADDRRAGFSNYGDWVDISAPGARILSTTRGGNYGYSDGTSMASPFAASVAILIRAAYPNLNVDDARQIFIEGADDIDDRNGQYGGQLGSGRINAYESLQLGLRPILCVEGLEVIRDDNNNEKLDPGEMIEMAVTISNGEFAESAEDMFVALYSDDPTIRFDNNFAEFPDLESGESFTNDDEPFTFTVDDNAIPHTTWFTVNVMAQPGDLEIDQEFELIVGHPDILVVDDDEGASFEQYYLESIEALNMGWVRWNVLTDYAPDPQTLTDYEMVIWVTGSSNPPLDPLDRFQLEYGLSEGANIMLIGKNIGDDAENDTLLRRFFGANHEADSVAALTVAGISESRPIDEDVEMLLFGAGEAGDGRISPSTMSLTRGGDSLLVYRRQEETTGLAGVYRFDPRTGSKTVYLGFAFEAISDRMTPKEEALSQLYNWFISDVESVELEFQAPHIYKLEPAFPNPFNSQVHLGYSLPYSSEYRLIISDLTGRDIATISSGAMPAGRYNTVWNAEGLPSGIYLLRLTIPSHAPIESKLVLVK